MRTVLFILMLCIGCSQQRSGEAVVGDSSGSVTRLPEPDSRALPELGEPLLIALAQARNYHHKADVYLRQGEVENAIAALREVLVLVFPDDAAEAEDVKLDARARLAKLLSAQGRIDEAMAMVDEGIARATRRSFFLANLYTVKGEVYEAMAAMLDEDEAAVEQAREARRNAIEALDQSIAINTELQRALMGEGP